MTSLQVMYYFGYEENFYDSFGSIRYGRHFRSAAAAIRSGSKMGCVELCNFHFCCASISCQPMKKFEFFGATRATRQRHSKTSSTGDEDVSDLAVGRLLVQPFDIANTINLKWVYRLIKGDLRNYYHIKAW